MVHRNPNVYENPLVWNPENFSAENMEKRNNYSFLGFSGGPRGCIGKSLLLSVPLQRPLYPFLALTHNGENLIRAHNTEW